MRESNDNETFDDLLGALVKDLTRKNSPNETEPSSISQTSPQMTTPQTSCNSNEAEPSDCMSKIRENLSPVKDAPKEMSLAKLRNKAVEIAESFQGECLSKDRLSIVKGSPAFKFKC